jgi:hypothetical protein
MIDASNSQWRIPYFLVQKKNIFVSKQKPRLVFDCRRVNELAKPLQYRLDSLNQILDYLAETEYLFFNSRPSQRILASSDFRKDHINMYIRIFLWPSWGKAIDNRANVFRKRVPATLRGHNGWATASKCFNLHRRPCCILKNRRGTDRKIARRFQPSARCKATNSPTQIVMVC